MNEHIERGQINADQYDILMRPLRPTRVANRSQGGKSLSYLESWDVRAHLIRVFGFGNFDMEMLDYRHIEDRRYMGGKDLDKEMVEAIYSCRMRLTVRDPQGGQIATYTEAAVGSTSGPANMLGEHHDNALKTAASDALKRCAINLGTQFGLSLYDNGTKADVVKMTVVKPEGVKVPEQPTAEQAAALAKSVGTPAPAVDPSSTEAQATDGTAAAIAAAQEGLGATVVPEAGSEAQTASEIAGEVRVQEVSHG